MHKYHNEIKKNQEFEFGMKETKLRDKRLEIIRSQALQLEFTAKNTTYKGAESIEGQYYRLRHNLVSIDQEAEKYLPDYRTKYYGGKRGVTIAVSIDFEELREKMILAIQQLIAYLNFETFTEERVETNTSSGAEEEILIPPEVIKNLPMEVKKTIQGICYNYRGGFTDFCFWGMRRALSDGIRIRFARDKKEKMLYDKNINPYGLSKWIELAKQERYISSNTAKDLNSQVKVFGDIASHDYKANLQKEEVPTIMTPLRMALSQMYYPKTQ